MRLLRSVFTFFYSVWCIVTFSLVLILLLFAYAAVYFQNDKQRTLNAYKANRALCSLWFKICGYKIVIEGWEKVNPSQVYVFTGNHCNMLDLPIAGYFLQHYYKSLAKKEFAYMPVLGFLFSIAAVFVDRKNAQSRQQSTQKMIHLLHKGLSFLIFPEGTRNKSEQPLLPFHKGAFKIAIAAQVPLQPFVLLGTRQLQPSGTYRFYPGTIRVQLLDAIPTTGLTDADTDALSEKVRQLMIQQIQNH
ncbi:MAG: lysophospholipid acyltransferase family protein [Chitinophagales bacterium]